MALLVTVFTTATAWAVDPWDGGTGTTEDPYYVNMPKTNYKSVTIPSGVQSFKVYDDGGATGNYSYYCDGYLTLTAPDGYVLLLSGNITINHSWSWLTVYDNSSANGTMLLDKVSSTSDGTKTDINPVNSTGQSMTINFYSGGTNYDGLDLTVTLISTSAESSITVNNPATGGTIAASVDGANAEKAKVNDIVTLTATPGSGYLLNDLSVADADGNPVRTTTTVPAP